jgi:hypothetical protein
MAIVLVVVILGVLIAEPWDQATPTVSADGSPIAAATLGSGEETETTSPYAQPSTGPTTSSRVGYRVEVGSAPSEVVRCVYRRRNDGRRWLSSVVVQPPRAYVVADAGTGLGREVGWRVEIQANRQETLFNADWRMVGLSSLQSAQAINGEQAPFDEISVELGAAELTNTTVIRARVTVSWFSPDGTLASRSEFVLPAYVAGANSSGPVLTDCPGVLRR